LVKDTIGYEKTAENILIEENYRRMLFC